MMFVLFLYIQFSDSSKIISIFLANGSLCLLYQITKESQKQAQIMLTVNKGNLINILAIPIGIHNSNPKKKRRAESIAFQNFDLIGWMTASFFSKSTTNGLVTNAGVP